MPTAEALFVFHLKRQPGTELLKHKRALCFLFSYKFHVAML